MTTIAPNPAPAVMDDVLSLVNVSTGAVNLYAAMGPAYAERGWTRPAKAFLVAVSGRRHRARLSLCAVPDHAHEQCGVATSLFPLGGRTTYVVGLGALYSI